jgi:hypothetical protein
MYGSLFWIEWLDRLDRVLAGTREDVVALSEAVNPRSLAGIESSKRQLAALTHDLQKLDPTVLTTDAAGAGEAAGPLQKALEATMVRLSDITRIESAPTPAIRDRVLAEIDSALRDSRYEAAMLLEPTRRRA